MNYTAYNAQPYSQLSVHTTRKGTKYHTQIANLSKEQFLANTINQAVMDKVPSLGWLVKDLEEGYDAKVKFIVGPYPTFRECYVAAQKYWKERKEGLYQSTTEEEKTAHPMFQTRPVFKIDPKTMTVVERFEKVKNAIQSAGGEDIYPSLKSIDGGKLVKKVTPIAGYLWYYVEEFSQYMKHQLDQKRDLLSIKKKKDDKVVPIVMMKAYVKSKHKQGMEILPIPLDMVDFNNLQ